MAKEETSMMKKMWSLLALVLALVLLAGSFVYLKNKPKKDDTAKVAEESAKEQISQLEKDKIVKMILTSSKGEIVFEKKDKEWKIPNANYKLNQTDIEDIAQSFASMQAEKVVSETAKDLENFGLKAPVVTAKAILSDGTEKVFYLGDKTPLGNTYYLMAKGNPKVYTVWMNHGEHFSTTLDKLRDRKFVVFEPAELNYLKIVPAGGKPIEIQTNVEEDESKAYGINLFRMIKPYIKPRSIDTEKMQAAIAAIPAFEIKDFVEDNPKDLSIYGLDKPVLEVEAKDNKQNSVHIFIGKDKDDKTVYFRTTDSKSVYTMDKNLIQPLKIDPFTVVEKFAYIVNIDNVDKITLQGNGKAHTITLTRQVTKKAEKEGEKDEITTTYKIDEKDIKEEDFKKYYQTLIGLIVDAEIDKKVDEKAEVTTTFYLNKGDEKQVTVKYAPYNENFYAVFRDGVSEFVISKEKVQKIFTEIEQLKSK
jgi:hypothetical protein